MAIKQSKSNVQEVQSRKEYREITNSKKRRVFTSSHMRKQQRQKRHEERKKNKIPIRRIFPIWLRVIVVLISCVLVLACGLMFGFGVIGDGNPTDALKIETWQHIIDYVTKD